MDKISQPTLINQQYFGCVFELGLPWKWSLSVAKDETLGFWNKIAQGQFLWWAQQYASNSVWTFQQNSSRTTPLMSSTIWQCQRTTPIWYHALFMTLCHVSGLETIPFMISCLAPGWIIGVLPSLPGLFIWDCISPSEIASPNSYKMFHPCSYDHHG